MTGSFRAIAAVFLGLAIAAPAHAHPLVYAPDGSITGSRHAWSFDDMFSTFATQGLDSKEKGKFTREELAPLAKVNVESLAEFEDFLRHKLTRIAGVSQVTSSFALRPVVYKTALPHRG